MFTRYGGIIAVATGVALLLLEISRPRANWSWFWILIAALVILMGVVNLVARRGKK